MCQHKHRKERGALTILTRYDRFTISFSQDPMCYDKIRHTEVVGFLSELTRSFSKKIRSDSGRQESDLTRSSSNGFRRIPMNSGSIRRWIRSEFLGIESRKPRLGDRSFFDGSKQNPCARKPIGTFACIRWSETSQIFDRFPGAWILIHTDRILSVLNAPDRILLSVLDLGRVLARKTFARPNDT